METQLTLFFLLIGIWMFLSVFLMFMACQKMSRAATRLERTLDASFGNGSAKAWLASLQRSSERAVTFTEKTKVEMDNLEETLERTQRSYRSSLSEIDSLTEGLALRVCESANDVKNAVSSPVFVLSAAASGLIKILQNGAAE